MSRRSRLVVVNVAKLTLEGNARSENRGREEKIAKCARLYPLDNERNEKRAAWARRMNRRDLLCQEYKKNKTEKRYEISHPCQENTSGVHDGNGWNIACGRNVISRFLCRQKEKSTKDRVKWRDDNANYKGESGRERGKGGVCRYNNKWDFAENGTVWLMQWDKKKKLVRNARGDDRWAQIVRISFLSLSLCETEGRM